MPTAPRSGRDTRKQVRMPATKFGKLQKKLRKKPEGGKLKGRKGKGKASHRSA